MISDNNLNKFDEVKYIKIEGKNDLQKKNLLNNDNLNGSSDNYDTNKNLIFKENLKQNNYFKKEKIEIKNKVIDNL